METTDSDQQRGGMQRRGWRRSKKRGDGNGGRVAAKVGKDGRRGKGAEVNIDCGWMQFFSPSPHLPPIHLLLWATEQEALHHPDRQRKRREGERKRDCDGGIKGYPSLSVTSFIVPCSVLPAHPSSAVTCTHTKIGTHFPPIFTHSQLQQTRSSIKDTQTPTDSQARWYTNRIISTDSHSEVVKHKQKTYKDIKPEKT